MPMMAKKKLLIYIASGVIMLACAYALFWRLDSGDKNDITKQMSECGLSSANGETISIRQGTVGRISGISIGLKSVKDGKANVQFWNADTNISGPTLTLGPCESANFEEHTVYVLAIKNKLENPFGGLGSGSDSVRVFIKN